MKLWQHDMLYLSTRFPFNALSRQYPANQASSGVHTLGIPCTMAQVLPYHNLSQLCSPELRRGWSVHRVPDDEGLVSAHCSGVCNQSTRGTIRRTCCLDLSAAPTQVVGAPRPLYYDGLVSAHGVNRRRASIRASEQPAIFTCGSICVSGATPPLD